MREIGACIYCGSLNSLTDEHYFPLSLGGTDILKKASCTECAKAINSRIESRVLGSQLANFRRNLGLPSRRNKKAKGKPGVYRDTLGRTFTVPAKDALTAALIYELCTAGVLCGRMEIFDDGAFTIASIHGKDDIEEQEFCQKYPLWDKTLTILPQPHLFAALIAKILHGAFINSFGMNGCIFYLPKVIIGDLSPLQLVGSVKRTDSPKIEGGMSFSGICISEHHALLIADYDIFNGGFDFIYQAVVGIVEISEMAKISEIKPAKFSASDTRTGRSATNDVLKHLRLLGLAVPS
ncbi:HNH endonuclease [Puniceibacterium antarcticum]|uniref:HNH endonuclease n=1 Tax=Puniceibacterium antarcticum TaxID=1206336 RepID=UPI001179DDB4|nr:HNH endonuclease [Puniceibacterium antarcticum]